MPDYRSSVKIEGEDKVLKAMQQFVLDTESSAGEILTEGAEILKSTAVELAPGPTGRKYGKYPHPPGTLKKSIAVGEVRRGRGRVYQAIGIEVNQYFTQGNKNQFYARFQEMGTKKMMASPFMRPALVKTRSKIREFVKDKLKEELFGNG